MIKQNLIRLKTFGNRKLSKYESLGYDIDKDFIDIKIEHLNIGSREIVDVDCDYCGNEVKVIYKEYLRNIKLGGKYACCKKCGSQKSEESNLVKYGNRHILSLESIKEKTKQTNLERFGVEYPMQSDVVKEKSKQSVRENYGQDHISQTDYYKEKFKQTNLERFGVEYPMQSEKVKKKSTITLNTNWGVDNPSQSHEIQNKIKTNNLEKWGFDNYSKTEESKNRIKETNLEKYGIEFYSKTEECKEKIKKTNLERYGVESYTKTDDFKIKSKKTNLEKYGVDSYSKTEDCKEKIKKNNIEKYGVSSFTKTEDCKNKIKETNLKKWGVDNPMKSNLYRKDFIITNHPGYVKYVGDGISLFNCELGHTFSISSDIFSHRRLEGDRICTVCYPINSKTSAMELYLFNFIKDNYSGKIVQSYRDGLEIDIYLPDLNIGFEFNGLYFHSEKFKDKYYHFNKNKLFSEKGVKIYHIWENDILERTDIVESQILNKINSPLDIVYARKCEVRIIKDSKLVREFLDKNHLQGFVNSEIKLGLFHKDDLVSVMTFDRLEGRNKMEDGGWNLNRFCSKIYHRVIGGSSKLLKFFIKKFSPKRIISYSDNSYSKGDLYINLGFIKIKDVPVDYKYLKERKLFNKQNFTKQKTGLNENSFTKENNYLKVWDCGKIKFEMILK